ncbi:MAG: hypothetical protein M3400_00925 [Actinomycetota bacterium]|nr:hypothetical protein [Actinomycetota bacterium]
MSESGIPTVLVVDMANVVGSVPNGWWRDRAGAAQKLLTGLLALAGRDVPGPESDLIRLVRIIAVLEGQANQATAPDAELSGGRLEIIRSEGSGDDEIAERVADLPVSGERVVLVVTADRGLRGRLRPAAETTGPSWLNRLLERG